MVNWYMKGQSDYVTANFHMGFYIDIDGFAEGDYDTRDMETHSESGDPFMTFGVDTETWVYGQGQVEIGLIESHRIRINSSGVYIWTAGDVWESVLGLGGASNLGELGDVVISGTPAEDEVLAWDNGSSKWINQTPAEAGLATTGHGHGQLHDESHSLASHSSEAHNELTGYNDETDVKHLTDSQLGALHTIYSLEVHDNTEHNPDFCVDDDARLSDDRNDASAIHVGIANEITGIDPKDPPVGADEFVIEDSEASYIKKALTFTVLNNNLVHNNLDGLNDGDNYEHITATEKGKIHDENHDNTYHSTNYHTESDGTGAVTVHSGITDAGSGIIITTDERTALHDIYTLEQHNNTFHSETYITQSAITTHTSSDTHASLTTHKTSTDHDGRYYTETEINNRIFEQTSTFPVSPTEGDFHYDEDDDSLYRYNAEAEAWIEIGATGVAGAAGDDLGNHTATTTLNMGGNTIDNTGRIQNGAAIHLAPYDGTSDEIVFGLSGGDMKMYQEGATESTEDGILGRMVNYTNAPFYNIISKDFTIDDGSFGFYSHVDDLQLLRDCVVWGVREKAMSDKFPNNKQKVFDVNTLPWIVAHSDVGAMAPDDNGKRYALGLHAVNGYFLSTMKKMLEKIDLLETRVIELEK